jgi:tRNA A37 threonylcarbamoyladenosine biosynthesis protein TsaE
LIVEWGERFPELFPRDRIEIRLKDAGGDNRMLEISYQPS